MTRPGPEVEEAQGAEQRQGSDAEGSEATGSDPEGSDPQGAEGARAGGQTPEESSTEGSDPQGAEEAPADPLAEAEAKRDEYLELAQRTQADFENYRKRTAQQAAQAGERAKVGLLRELLPVVDNLERAEKAAADSEGPLHEGVKLVLADLQGVLAREGVEAIEPVGEQFDPNVHEAISIAPQEGTESGVVVDVVEKGYRSRDTVIRPARVVVSA